MRLYITRQFILPFPQKLPKHGKGLFFLMNTHVSKLPNFKYRKFGHLILKNHNQAKRDRLYSPVSFCIRHMCIKIYKLNLYPMYF